MTTVYKHNLLMLSFQGRSPRQIYKEACEEHHVYVQDALVEVLSNTPDDFGKLQHLLCADIAFGPKGCMALVPIIQVSHHLRRVDLKGCGLTDEFLVHLVDGLQEHPTIRTIDLSNNPFITVNSGKALVKMVELNPNIVVCALDGTHVGRNVAKVVTSRCEVNRHRLMSYFCDDFFKMKDLFNSVDADGSGWVHIKNIVGSIPAPILRERMWERIALKKPKGKTKDSKEIDFNSFLEVVYLNYKTIDEIASRQREPDAAAAVIKSNWKHVIEALKKHHVTCSRLDKFRPSREMELTAEEAQELVADAVQLQQLPTQGAENGEEPHDVDVACLLAAFKHKFPPLPAHPKVYGFLKERSEDYVSPLLLSGSRPASSIDMTSSAAVSEALGSDDVDPPHTWKLPPSMVRRIVAVLGGVYERQDGSGSSSLNSNNKPAAIQTSIDVEKLLMLSEEQLDTDLEKVRLKGLATKFAEYSMPFDITTLTLQEVVNMLDEYYDVLRVDKKFEFDDIKKMCS